MSTPVFYGAGENAKRGLAQWIDWGLEPVCFVDADASKQHTLFFGKYQILSLSEAMQRYPDYTLYLTVAPENVSPILQYLLEAGIPEERIQALAYDARNEHYLYLGMERIYQALGDSLSRKLFWGRHEYSLSHVLTGVYRAMIDDENMMWLKSKRTYAERRYGMKHGLWHLLHENYPYQRNEIYLLAFDDAWNEYDWIVERFLDAMPGLGIHIKACVMPYADGKYQKFKGLPCVSEQEFLKNIDENTRAIIGFPGWVLETKKIVERYAAHKDILIPIADTAHPQYIEPNIFPPEEGEIYVDVGVMDFQNSLDFAAWAKKGWKKIYAFEPDPTCYRNSMKRLQGGDKSFSSKVELVNKGLSDYNGTAEFPAVWTGSGQHDSDEMIAVDVVTLDSYLNGRPVTFVKMDVEGAEMQVLRGMKKTILHYKPKLAVCIYHKHEDLTDIGSYLLHLVPEYKFYIRHYNSNETETVLFAKV